MITIKSFARLHIALIDLNGITGRSYGGIGMMIDCPAFEVSANISSIGLTIDVCNVDDASIIAINHILNQIVPNLNQKGLTLTVRKYVDQHIGLGSKTALLLALLQSVNSCLDLKLTKGQMQRISARGGASGIGIHGFFSGGLIVDAGHPFQSPIFLPSSSLYPVNVPQLIVNCSIPKEWIFHLLLPRGNEFSGANEIDFFIKNTPIPADEVLRTLGIVYHQIVTGVLSNDLSIVKSGIRDIQNLGFKAREVNAQGTAIKELISELDRNTPCAVGMSSVGPLVYAIASFDDKALTSIIKHISLSKEAQYIGAYGPRNTRFEEICNDSI